MWLIRFPVIDEKSESRKQLEEMVQEYKEFTGFLEVSFSASGMNSHQ